MKEIHLCRSEEALMDLAANRAKTLRGGEVFALEGNLGLGKTAFVKGLARGLGSASLVTSPTFNLVHRYSGRLLLIHYDLYRLKQFGEIEALDLETELQSSHVLAIEWPQLAASILPSDRTVWVRLKEIGESERQVTFTSTTERIVGMRSPQN